MEKEKGFERVCLCVLEREKKKRKEIYSRVK